MIDKVTSLNEFNDDDVSLVLKQKIHLQSIIWRDFFNFRNCKDLDNDKFRPQIGSKLRKFAGNPI